MKIIIIHSLVVFCLFSFIISPLTAQNNYHKDKWNFKLDYSQGPFKNLDGKKSGNIRLEVDHGISNLIEAGAYLGMTKYNRYEYLYTDTLNLPHFNVEYKSAPLWGIGLNFHPLPLLIHQEGFRFDLYLAGKFGGIYFFGKENDTPQGTKLQVFMGGGIAFYLIKNAGLFIEYGNELNTAGRKSWDDRLYAGITIKL